jgi:hypothetical protein
MSLPDFLAALARVASLELQLRDALADAFSRKDWISLQYLVIGASRHPDRSYTPTLCAILDEMNQKMTNEDVVQVLDIIADERSIPCLRRAVDTDFEWDIAHHFNMKCIWALERIGTAEAKAALEEVRDHWIEDVGQMASKALKEWESD